MNITKSLAFCLHWLKQQFSSKPIAFIAPILLLLVGLTVGSFLTKEEWGTDELGSNLFVFGIVNFNLLALCLLIIVVGRNLVKLIFDRRRNILGSRLRMRLVGAFVGLTLVPTVLVFLLASGFLSRAVEGWFGKQVESSVEAAVDVARFYVQEKRGEVEKAGASVGNILKQRPVAHGESEALRKILNDSRREWDLFSVRVMTTVKKSLGSSLHTMSSIPEFAEPELNAELFQRALSDGVISAREEVKSRQFVRAYTKGFLGNQDVIIVTTKMLEPDLSRVITDLNEAYQEYAQLKLFKGPLKSSYTVTLSLLTALLIFAAIWFGFYIARQLTVPIQRLAEGTREVARGNYDVQIPLVGDDELSILVQSFNQMTDDLRRSRQDGERRRVFIETILANLAVGVVALDSEKRVTTVNEAARKMFSLSSSEDLIGQDARVLLTQMVSDNEEHILELLNSASAHSDGVTAYELDVEASRSGERYKKLLVTAGVVPEAHSGEAGIVLLFDDVTQLMKAQQMAAWREVAKRIAHEIKNPLTPIQLSAQRIERALQRGDSELVGNLSHVILENVSSIKRLVDEFSRFARMPAAEVQLTDLTQLLTEVLSPYASLHDDIQFHLIVDPELPNAQVDPEQIRRLIMNLVDNAVLALAEEGGMPQAPKKITVRAQSSREGQAVSIEVSDNGPGIPAEHRDKIFNPYFTTRSTGTGLGLAIVTSIVSEHHGEIELSSNEPKGTKIVVRIPVKTQASGPRRFSA